jgi:hypothetical protein
VRPEPLSAELDQRRGEFVGCDTGGGGAGSGGAQGRWGHLSYLIPSKDQILQEQATFSLSSRIASPQSG